MKKARILAALMLASALALHLLWAEQTGNAPGNSNREEQSKMTDEPLLMGLTELISFIPLLRV